MTKIIKGRHKKWNTGPQGDRKNLKNIYHAWENKPHQIKNTKNYSEKNWKK
jgi:hypothetical protein